MGGGVATLRLLILKYARWCRMPKGSKALTSMYLSVLRVVLDPDVYRNAGTDLGSPGSILTGSDLREA